MSRTPRGEVVAEISDPGADVQHEHRAVVERELDARRVAAADHRGRARRGHGTATAPDLQLHTASTLPRQKIVAAPTNSSAWASRTPVDLPIDAVGARDHERLVDRAALVERDPGRPPLGRQRLQVRVRGLRLAVNSSTGTSPTPAKEAGRRGASAASLKKTSRPASFTIIVGVARLDANSRQDENQVLGSPLGQGTSVRRTAVRWKAQPKEEQVLARVATFESTDPAADEQLMGQAMETVEPMIRGLNGIQGFMELADRNPASRSRSASSTRRRMHSRPSRFSRRRCLVRWAT